MTKALEQAEKISGVKPKHAYADLGYRGHDYTGDCDVHIINRFRRSKARSLLKWWKRRSAIEPVIDHVKSDNYMERNRLAGTRGDGLCAILAAVGFNLRKLMRGLKRLFFCLFRESVDYAVRLCEELSEAIKCALPFKWQTIPLCLASKTTTLFTKARFA